MHGWCLFGMGTPHARGSKLICVTTVWVRIWHAARTPLPFPPLPCPHLSPSLHCLHAACTSWVRVHAGTRVAPWMAFPSAVRPGTLRTVATGQPLWTDLSGGFTMLPLASASAHLLEARDVGSVTVRSGVVCTCMLLRGCRPAPVVRRPVPTPSPSESLRDRRTPCSRHPRPWAPLGYRRCPPAPPVRPLWTLRQM